MKPWDKNLHTEEKKVWTTSPAEAIELELEADGFPQEVYYCMVERPEDGGEEKECDESEYQVYRGSIRAPKSGLWQIYYYGEDAAGNRSEVSETEFLVY